MGWLLSSVGIKRYIASGLAVLVEVLKVVPGAGEAITAIDLIAGIFGVTGLAHATGRGTLTKAKLAGISSFLTILILVAGFVPAMAPFVPMLQQLAAIFGAAGVGAVAAIKLK